MPTIDWPLLTDRDVIAARGPKTPVDPWRPIGSFVELERQADGRILDAATILLANRECPFHCVFCDLWRHTLDEPTPSGAVPHQIDMALAELRTASVSERPAPTVLKLYNSGNFFDAAANPREDWPAIAVLCQNFERVIVENHPRLVDQRCIDFRDLLANTREKGVRTLFNDPILLDKKGPDPFSANTRLEVAMGLETVHPDVLPRLNKRMTLGDFSNAAQFLIDHDIAVRAFVLLRPPFLTETEGIEWAVRSIEFAFECGVSCVSIIPSRGGNGLLDQWKSAGLFGEPTLASLEIATERGINLNRGRVFADLWDAERFAECSACPAERIERLRTMNLTQTIPPRVACKQCERRS